jgi:hypothetical protein
MVVSDAAAIRTDQRQIGRLRREVALDDLIFDLAVDPRRGRLCCLTRSPKRRPTFAPVSSPSFRPPSGWAKTHVRLADAAPFDARVFKSVPVTESSCGPRRLDARRAPGGSSVAVPGIFDVVLHVRRNAATVTFWSPEGLPSTSRNCSWPWS